LINPLCITKPPRHTGHTSNDGGSLVSGRRSTTNLRTILAVACGRAVSLVLRLLTHERGRRAVAVTSLCLGLAVQMGLCFTAMYLIDLSISLFGLWTELARKHLELTL